jgi:hypothetical protein
MTQECPRDSEQLYDEVLKLQRLVMEVIGQHCHELETPSAKCEPQCQSLPYVSSSNPFLVSHQSLGLLKQLGWF